MVSKILRADGVTELASIKSVTYHESVNADIDLRPGCVASTYIEVTCFGAQSDAPDVGEALTYYQVVGETETLIGIFYAEPSIPTKNSYSFVAYDAVHKLDADFSSWLSANQENFPYTVKQLVSQACTIAGVTLGTSSWTYSAMSVNAFYADGITCRNILQYAAEIACKFVRCNTSGEIIFDWYNNLSKNFLPIDDISLERTNNRTKTVILDEVIPAGTYVFSWSYSGTSTATSFTFRKQSGSDVIATVRVDQSSPQTITLSDDCYRIYAYISTNQASGATAEVSDITLKNAVQYRIYPTTGTFNGEECYAYKQDGLTYDNYDTSELARVAVHPVGEDDVAYYYPTGVTSGNTLDITNNALLYGASAANMTSIAQTVYNGITAVGQYRPMDVSMFPNECPFKSGQIVPVTDAQGVSFTTAIMSKVVTDSAVTLTSTGREVYGDYALDTAKKLIQLAADIVQINKLKVDWAEIDQIFARDITVTGKLHSEDYRYTTGSIYASAGMGIDFSAKRMNTPNFALTPSGDIHARGGQIAGFNISRSISVAYYAAAPSFFDVDGAASTNYTWESATHKMTLGEDGTVRYQPANKSYLVDGQVVNLSSVWVRCVYGGRINDSWYTPFVVISYLDASDNVIYQEDWSNINYQAPDGTSGSRILVNQTYLAAASKVRFDLRLLDGDYCSGCEYDYGVTSSLNYNADRIGSANGIYLGTDGISVGDGNVLTPDGSGRIGQLTTKKNIVQADKAEYVTIEEGLYGQVGKNVPSSAQNKCGDVVYDADNYMIWYSRISRLSNDLLYRSFVIQRLLSDGVTKAQNGFYLRLDDTGNPSVAFTANAATAWLKALGIDWNTGFSGIYTDYTQLGFTSVPTMSALVSTMPTQSIAMMTNTMVDQSEMTLPDGSNYHASVVVIFKQTNVRAFAIGGRAYANVQLLNAGLYYAAWNSTAWVGWKKLVTENNNGYLAGETLSFTSALYNVMWTGLAPNTTIVRFEIPLTRQVLATSASVSGSVRIRGGGINSLVSLADANVATAVTINPCGIGVQLTFSSQHFFSANMVVTVHPETSFSITFS